jgi:chromate transporter
MGDRGSLFGRYSDPPGGGRVAVYRCGTCRHPLLRQYFPATTSTGGYADRRGALGPAGASSIKLDAGKASAVFPQAGSLTFGSGLVIVPFLQQGVVQQYGWLDERQSLIAVGVGMISPGPVVITATFVGYLVAGFWGSLVSTVGIFFPSFILVLVVAPLLARHRENPNVQGFVHGAYAAAIGTILGACILLGRIAIGDWLTALIGLASLAVLFRWKVNNPLLIAATAVIGLIAFPILQPTWVMVK